MDDLQITTSLDTSHVIQCLTCGREFAQTNAYSIHARNCRPQKKRMASALEIARENYRRKKARLSHPPVEEQIPQSTTQTAGASVEVSSLHVLLISSINVEVSDLSYYIGISNY